MAHFCVYSEKSKAKVSRLGISQQQVSEDKVAGIPQSTARKANARTS